MSLNGKQKVYLRGLAHHKPVAVTVGNAGLSPAVIAEITQSLLAHELLKIKLPAGSPEHKKQLLATLCEQTGAQAVQQIGRIGVIYKTGDPGKIELP